MFVVVVFVLCFSVGCCKFALCSRGSVLFVLMFVILFDDCCVRWFVAVCFCVFALFCCVVMLVLCCC